jgi:hypothetical protein
MKNKNAIVTAVSVANAVELMAGIATRLANKELSTAIDQKTVSSANVSDMIAMAFQRKYRAHLTNDKV